MHLPLRHTTLAVVLICVVSTAHAITASEIYEQAIKSTVVVENIDAKGDVQSMGSGVVLADRDVVTNCHVVKDANQLQVRSAGKTYPATLHYSDWDRDVCSLSITGFSAPAVVVGSTKTLKVGTKVYAIGAPQGLELTLSDGIVSSLREVEGGHYIQTTAAISPGSSGGGLFDENGALVGLTTFYLTKGQNLNFAVPVEWVTELAKRSTKAETGTQPITVWLNKAIELESRKDWPTLLEHCRRWTKAQPGSGLAWYNLGAAYDYSGQSAKAIAAYQQALRINPGIAEAWNNLGIAYDDVGQFDKAIEASQQALRINPEDATTWHNLGVAYGKAGQPAKAIEASQQALRINPEDATMWNNLGVVYGKAGQSAKAVEAYEQALRINPEYAGAWYNLGAAYPETDSAKAVEAYQQALRINPKFASAWINIGNVYDNEGQFIKAIEAYKQAVRINPEFAMAWSNLGLVYGKTGQFAKVIEACQQALRINPQYADAWSNLGVAYSGLGQRDKVLEVYKRLKTLDSALAERFFNGVVLP